MSKRNKNKYNEYICMNYNLGMKFGDFDIELACSECDLAEKCKKESEKSILCKYCPYGLSQQMEECKDLCDTHALCPYNEDEEEPKSAIENEIEKVKKELGKTDKELNKTDNKNFYSFEINYKQKTLLKDETNVKFLVFIDPSSISKINSFIKDVIFTNNDDAIIKCTRKRNENE
jgi:hypothetical protein